jgi:hypothetical protein
MSKLEELPMDHITDLKELVSKKRKKDDATLTSGTVCSQQKKHMV